MRKLCSAIDIRAIRRYLFQLLEKVAEREKLKLSFIRPRWCTHYVSWRSNWANYRVKAS